MFNGLCKFISAQYRYPLFFHLNYSNCFWIFALNIITDSYCLLNLKHLVNNLIDVVIVDYYVVLCDSWYNFEVDGFTFSN